MKTYKQLLEENKGWAEETFAKIKGKLDKTTVRNKNIIADWVDKNGRYQDCRGIEFWTNGFWGGLNMLMYSHTKNPDYLATARVQEERLDEIILHRFTELYHDVGFMWHILSGANYRLTGDEESKNRNLLAAASLFSRYVIDGGYIIAWNTQPNWTIIDCLMNLPTLYWASNELGDDRFKRVAMAHADMAIMHHIREDGSVVHIVEHDRETGEPVATYGGQGYEVGSSWSRGQSWALYGFVISYIHTGEERYLNAAKRAANYFIANCCDDWLPRVDFRAPAEPVLYDSTAGACAACGLIELGKLLGEHEGGMYMHAAINILRAMDKKFCNYDEDKDYILGYGTTRYPTDGDYERAGVHIPIIYGDYFYTEAVLKLIGADFFPW